jgi:hypothetical protein
MKTTPLTVIFILLTLTTSFASISGTVTDYSTGNPLANVHVSCSNNETTHTDNHGFYEFENLSYGVFDFTFTKTGYQSLTKEKVYVGNQTS